MGRGVAGPSSSVMVPDAMSLSMPDSVIETSVVLAPPVGLAALSARGAASAVVSSVKVLLGGAALLPVSSVTEADTVIRLSA